ncbi:DNA-binding protein, partial [Mycobacterium kansasii]
LWRVGDEVVAEMVFRILKFRPPSADSPEATVPDAGPSGRIVDASAYAGGVLRPVISRDTAFYWEGAKLGELRIQRW